MRIDFIKQLKLPVQILAVQVPDSRESYKHLTIGFEYDGNLHLIKSNQRDNISEKREFCLWLLDSYTFRPCVYVTDSWFHYDAVKLNVRPRVILKYKA